MQQKLWYNLRMFLWMTFLTGILYPLVITAIAQLTMSQKASGDFLLVNKSIVGAKLIGQKFELDKYFWGRPSSTEYNALPSGGSNLGPISPILKNAVKEREELLLKTHHIDKESIPSELLFTSGSGLDPHISPSTAYFQADRVARTRNISTTEINKLIDKMIVKQSLGFLGKTCINVLMLNIALDELSENLTQAKEVIPKL